MVLIMSVFDVGIAYLGISPANLQSLVPADWLHNYFTLHGIVVFFWSNAISLMYSSMSYSISLCIGLLR